HAPLPYLPSFPTRRSSDLDALPLDTLVGPYRVLGQRGSGGMGVVYQALDTRLGRPVALKMVLATPLPEECARFRTEAEAIAQLQDRKSTRLNSSHVSTSYA